MKRLENGMPFVKDEAVIGKWEFFASLPTNSQWDGSCPDTLSDAEKEFEEIYFLPEGQKYWIFEGWTKGYLLVHYGGNEPVLCYRYHLESRNEKEFLFLQLDGKADAPVTVMKKVSGRAFRLEEIGRRDNVDMPFRMDEKLLGQWKTVGFADSIEAFAGPVDSQDELWLKTVEFCADGTAIRSYGEETWHDKWTKGFLLDLKKSTASAYSFQRILGTEYLFLEWKMGNYVYGGLELGYYVFVKL